MILQRLIVVAVVASATTASAEGYVRVIAQRAPVHSGPGVGYREVYYAERGQVFEVLERGTRDYWYKIALDDGTTGWIVGDLVYPFAVRDSIRFAESPLAGASILQYAGQSDGARVYRQLADAVLNEKAAGVPGRVAEQGR